MKLLQRIIGSGTDQYPLSVIWWSGHGVWYSSVDIECGSTTLWYGGGV